MREHEVFLGPVLAGANATRELVLENRGDSSLLIRMLQSGCRCLDASVADPNLLAGATTTLFLSYRARVQPGTEEADLIIRTSDPAARQVQLSVSAFVYRPVVIEPEVFQLRAAQRGRRYAQPFELLQWDRGPLSASMSGALPAGVTVLWEKRDAARPWIARGTVEYAVPATGVPGEIIQKTVEFSTRCPDQPVVSLSLAGYVAGLLSADPERLSFGVVRGASPVSREFVLRCEPPHRLDQGASVEISFQEPRLSVECIHQTSCEARLRVTLRPDGAAREIRIRLRVAPPAPGLPALEIPVRAVLVP